MTLRSALPRVLLGLAILAGALWLAFNGDRFDPLAVEALIRNLGFWGPLVHVMLFALGTVLFVPGALFGLAGGVLFGPVWGTILNLTGATLGATAAFLVARYVVADWVRQRTGTRLQTLIQGVEAEGWRFVAFTRLVPLIPFNLLNYALGLTRIPVVAYILTSFACMVPGTLAYTWVGHAGREAMAGNQAAIRYGLMALAVLATVAFLPRLLRRLRKERAPRWIEPPELAAHLDGAGDCAVIDVRGPDEFTGPLGHIAGARNVALADLCDRIGELGALPGTPLVLVCHTDKRSARAAVLLEDAGFRDVLVLRGGMARWTRAGLPVADRISATAE